MFYDPRFTQNIVDIIFFKCLQYISYKTSYFIVGLLQRKSPMN